jgi:hypothetical protein
MACETRDNRAIVALTGSAATDVPTEYGKIPEVRRRFGIPRSRQYVLAARGDILFKKDGRATLVDFASVRRYLANLPPARIRPSLGSNSRNTT